MQLTAVPYIFLIDYCSSHATILLVLVRCILYYATINAVAGDNPRDISSSSLSSSSVVVIHGSLARTLAKSLHGGEIRCVVH